MALFVDDRRTARCVNCNKSKPTEYTLVWITSVNECNHCHSRLEDKRNYNFCSLKCLKERIHSL